MRVANPLKSGMLNACFGAGRIILFHFVLKIPDEGGFHRAQIFKKVGVKFC